MTRKVTAILFIVAWGLVFLAAMIGG